MAAEVNLRRALAQSSKPEPRRRLEALLAKLDPARCPDQLRRVRAVQLLEQVGNAEAKQVLEILATGAPEARLTQEARDTLLRLTR